MVRHIEVRHEGEAVVRAGEGAGPDGGEAVLQRPRVRVLGRELGERPGQPLLLLPGGAHHRGVLQLVELGAGLEAERQRELVLRGEESKEVFLPPV